MIRRPPTLLELTIEEEDQIRGFATQVAAQAAAQRGHAPSAAPQRGSAAAETAEDQEDGAMEAMDVEE